jgi:hypothetical protein
MKSVPTSLGTRFTETSCGLDYLSTDKHRHGNVPTHPGQHSSWCISRNDEADSFCQSVNAGHADATGDLWYAERVGNRLRRLGTADEKLALFQAPSNECDPWHGHPRGHRGRADYPSAVLLRALKDAGVITNVEYRRVRNGDIP